MFRHRTKIIKAALISSSNSQTGDYISVFPKALKLLCWNHPKSISYHLHHSVLLSRITIISTLRLSATAAHPRVYACNADFTHRPVLVISNWVWLHEKHGGCLTRALQVKWPCMHAPTRVCVFVCVCVTVAGFRETTERTVNHVKHTVYSFHPYYSARPLTVHKEGWNYTAEVLIRKPFCITEHQRIEFKLPYFLWTHFVYDHIKHCRQRAAWRRLAPPETATVANTRGRKHLQWAAVKCYSPFLNFLFLFVLSRRICFLCKRV